MITLSPRQVKCLKLIWQERDFCTAGYLAEKLQVSNKTVLQDIKAIQKYLDPFHVTLVRKTGKGIYLPAKARGNQELLNSLRLDWDETSPMSIEARRAEITKRVLLMDENDLSIQKLSDEFYVSRGSIVNDFKAVEQWVSQYNLTLATGHKGRKLQGSERGIRHAIAAWIRENNPTKNTEITPGEYIASQTNSRFMHTGFFDEDEIQLSGEMMDYLETACGHMISEPYYSYLRDHILICISRARRKHFIEPKEDIPGEMKWQLVSYAHGLLDVARKKWEIPEQEVHYLYKYLVSSDIMSPKKETAAVNEESEYPDIAQMVARDLSRCVVKALRITVEDHSDLMKGLLQHIRPMLRRLMYDIHIQSSILADMQENYGELLGLCQAALWCICRKYSLKEVSLNETSYIAAYYQAMLETKRMEKKIIVVSNSGFGTTQLLVTRLRQHFPFFEITEVLSMLQLEKRTCLDGIDFLISTMPLESAAVPCIFVSAVLSDSDIRNIQDILSASWLEEPLSLTHLKKQYEAGGLKLHTVENDANELYRHPSPYQEKHLFWGRCLETVIGISRESHITIYRRELESDIWQLSMHAHSYDELLEWLPDAYQMLCIPKGRRLTEKCYRTEDLKLVFESSEGETI